MLLFVCLGFFSGTPSSTAGPALPFSHRLSFCNCPAHLEMWYKCLQNHLRSGSCPARSAHGKYAGHKEAHGGTSWLTVHWVQHSSSCSQPCRNHTSSSTQRGSAMCKKQKGKRKENSQRKLDTLLPAVGQGFLSFIFPPRCQYD